MLPGRPRAKCRRRASRAGSEDMGQASRPAAQGRQASVPRRRRSSCHRDDGRGTICWLRMACNGQFKVVRRPGTQQRVPRSAARTGIAVSAGPYPCGSAVRSKVRRHPGDDSGGAATREAHGDIQLVPPPGLTLTLVSLPAMVLAIITPCSFHPLTPGNGAQGQKGNRASQPRGPVAG